MSIDLQPDTPPQERSRPATAGWFRAFWRWHFYASFLVAPILLILATTGLIYLLRFQLEPLLHPDLMRVEAPAANAVAESYDVQLRAAQAEVPDGVVVSMTEPRDLDRPTVFSAELPDGSTRDVFVDPRTGDALGSLDPDTTLSGYAVRLHGELMAGPWGDHLIELGACWAIVMAVTGYYLFWRGRAARRRQRSELRSRHARIGAVVGVCLLLLIVSGLPWTGFWGERAQQLAMDNGSSLWGLDPGTASEPSSTLDESLPHSHAHEVPWAMGESEVPASHGDGGSAIGLAEAVAVAADWKVRHPMTVALPAGEDDVYSAIGYAFDAPSEERTVHINQYDGRVLATYGFDQYPLLAKVVSQGIGLHEGRSLGSWSFWGALLMCLAVIASCVTGPLMWWRRRPSRSLGAPRGRLPLRASLFMLVTVVAFGVFLPLFGLSLVVVLALDHLVIRRVPQLSTWFGTSRPI